jgi:hypothetical protein
MLVNGRIEKFVIPLSEYKSISFIRVNIYANNKKSSRNIRMGFNL